MLLPSALARPGLAALVLAGLRLYPESRGTFCSGFNDNGEEPTLYPAAWTEFFAFGSPPLCWEALLVCLWPQSAGRQSRE